MVMTHDAMQLGGLFELVLRQAIALHMLQEHSQRGCQLLIRHRRRPSGLAIRLEVERDATLSQHHPQVPQGVI